MLILKELIILKWCKLKEFGKLSECVRIFYENMLVKTFCRVPTVLITSSSKFYLVNKPPMMGSFRVKNVTLLTV